MNFRGLVLAGSLAFVVSSCADETFTVEYASDYTKRPANVSFFGVFQDGRVNASAWEQFGPRFSLSFSGAPCPALAANDLSTQDPELSSALDSYARANGVTDDLLEKIAPMAKGDVIVVITIAGHPPQPIGAAAGAVPSAPLPMMRGSGRRGGGGGGSMRSAEPPTDHNVFELAATLYSVRAHHTVGVIAMSYNGSSVAEALAKFTDRFQAETASSRCSGWAWDHKIDPDDIRKMSDDSRER